MARTTPINKNYTLSKLNDLIEAGRAFEIPFVINKVAYILINGTPFMVVVTDVSIKGIQLSGQWYNWEELELMGGVFETEFDALKSVTDKK
ncbi:MAG: hypothetical protein K6E56_00640 [Lachnospiraceae bacterium]|nr:hypothetical protein [Lachnospiraceae bacterium]